MVWMDGWMDGWVGIDDADDDDDECCSWKRPTLGHFFPVLSFFQTSCQFSKISKIRNGFLDIIVCILQIGPVRFYVLKGREEGPTHL